MLQNDHRENPYASPQSSSLAVDVAEITDSYSQQLETFVGPRARYYLNKWAPVLRGDSGDVGFNWAAFLLTGFWLPYRKMYKFTLIFYSLILLESTLEEVVFVGILGNEEPPAVLGTIVAIAAATICGAYGNRWYLSHARGVIAEANASGLHAGDLLQRIARQGGTSIAASLGMFALFVIALIAVFLPLEFLLYEV